MTTLKLTEEIRQALQEHPDRPVEIEDEVTRQVYLLIPKPTAAEMMHATSHEAIQAGIDDVEAGRVVPYDEVSRTFARCWDCRHGHERPPGHLRR